MSIAQPPDPIDPPDCSICHALRDNDTCALHGSRNGRRLRAGLITFPDVLPGPAVVSSERTPVQAAAHGVGQALGWLILAAVFAIVSVAIVKASTLLIGLMLS